MAECWNIDDNGVKTLLACGDLPEDLAHTADNEATGTYGVVDHDGDDTTDALAVTDIIAVEDESGQHDTWAIGIGYTDGPMSVSVGHMTREQEDGVERTATMVSAGYKLAPGVAWKTSIFGVEDTGSGAEGTAFVTGLDIDF